MLDKLPVPEILLASKSPRRRLLLERIGLSYVAFEPIIEESVPRKSLCRETALANARMKALAALDMADGRAILGADTVVDLDGEPLGKPETTEEAFKMLTRLSGREHLVHTGIHLVESANRLKYDAVETTRVKFRQLGVAEIEAYISTGEPLDKAGAYGIQERGAMLVERIDGCFFNVMGLPLARLWEMIRQWMRERGTPLERW